MKLMIMLLISLLLATGVEARLFSEEKCKKKCPSPQCEPDFNTDISRPSSERKCKKKCPQCEPHTFTSKDSLKAAVKAFKEDSAEAEQVYGRIADWDVSAITDMSELFFFCRDFNADISNWDTSRVTTMRGMFSWAENFNADISNWDTSRVTDMSGMLNGATAFNQPLSFDTSRVTDMSWMFAYAEAFNQRLPVSFDTSHVTNMAGMFNRAEAFNQRLSFDTSRVTDMDSMFRDPNSLSAANKLLIRCEWADTDAFASAGYDDSWAPGNC